MCPVGVLIVSLLGLPSAAGSVVDSHPGISLARLKRLQCPRPLSGSVPPPSAKRRAWSMSWIAASHQGVRQR